MLAAENSGRGREVKLKGEGERRNIAFARPRFRFGLSRAPRETPTSGGYSGRLGGLEKMENLSKNLPYYQYHFLCILRPIFDSLSITSDRRSRFWRFSSSLVSKRLSCRLLSGVS